MIIIVVNNIKYSRFLIKCIYSYTIGYIEFNIICGYTQWDSNVRDGITRI